MIALRDTDWEKLLSEKCKVVLGPQQDISSLKNINKENTRFISKYRHPLFDPFRLLVDLVNRRKQNDDHLVDHLWTHTIV